MVSAEVLEKNSSRTIGRLFQLSYSSNWFPITGPRRIGDHRRVAREHLLRAADSALNNYRCKIIALT